MRRLLLLSLLLATATAAGQSITVSGGRTSIIVSGTAPAASTVQEANRPAVPVPPPTEAPAPPIEIVPAQKVPVSPPPVIVQQPILQVAYAPFRCPPCELFKTDLRNGRFPGIRVEQVPDWPGLKAYPAFRWKTRNGEWASPTANGYGDSVRLEILTAFGRQPAQAVAPTPPARQLLPTVDTQWGRINLETYDRNCSCAMCRGIRSLQQQYRQQQATPPQQAPTPDAVINQMLELLRLTPTDVLADLGCGDGRILIEATRQYDCAGIGVEIDPAKAEQARARVAEAGLSHRIHILTGDAREFVPADHGVTAATVYLYPELLKQLAPRLGQITRVGSPYHQIPDLAMTQHGDVWLYRRSL